MPSHQARREPLPEGYQFGDAIGLVEADGAIVARLYPRWLRDYDRSIGRLVYQKVASTPVNLMTFKGASL